METQEPSGTDKNRLVDAAVEARAAAYAPYSHFGVGAALLGDDGQIYTGCNVEGASYGNAICAERVALCKAVSEGQRKFVMLAVYADTEEPCTPCGICRQMLYEFAPDLLVLCVRGDRSWQEHRLCDLLPCAFSGQDMEREER